MSNIEQDELQMLKSGCVKPPSFRVIEAPMPASPPHLVSHVC